jgi:16S rRNA (guanine527-N7)-methyltransferase
MERLISAVTGLGIKLDNHQIAQFETYYRQLVDWNQRINLTAITDYEEVQLKHFLDSLTVFLALRQPSDWYRSKAIDVGSGAGLPGIPLKIVAPELQLTLLEATAKKANFLHHVVHNLGLASVKVLTGRAEDFGQIGEYRERYDLVLSRAVAALPVLAELTLPFCVIGGCFVAQKQAAARLEVEQANVAVGILGGKLREIVQVDFPPLLEGRCLIVYDKVSPTPVGYPRRPGVPVKRPL